MIYLNDKEHFSIGGGLGGTRRGGADVNVRHSGREDGGGRRSRSRDRDRGMDGFGGGSRRRSRYTMTSCVRRAPGIRMTSVKFS